MTIEINLQTTPEEYDIELSNYNPVVWGDITGTLSNQTDLSNAIAASDKVFICTYGTTTNAQISAAINAGKFPVVKYTNDGIVEYYPYARKLQGSTGHIFGSMAPEDFSGGSTNVGRILSVTGANTWQTITQSSYTKPATGIPSTDMTTAVQTSLGKADTALQSHQSLAAYRTAAAQDAIHDATKQNVLTAGQNITIVNDVISATGANAIWGNISGTLSNQQDLSDALNAKGTYSKPASGIPKADLASSVQTSLGKADTALQSHQSLSAYRTSADQDIIDATKANTSDLSTVATSGSYNDLSNKPTIPVVPTNVSAFTNDAGYLTSHQSLAAYRTSSAQDAIDATKASAADVDAIETKIPSQATSSNQLADKAFVNSSIATNTANYISNNGEPFTSVAQLEAYSGTVTNNDYAFVTGTEAGNSYYDRYKATVVGSTRTWAKEYRLNNSSFTSQQWAAISSGITNTKVGNYDTHIADTGIHVTTSDKTTWSGKQDALVSGTNIKTINSTSLLGSGNIDINSAVWGQVSGTLSNQTDLQTALNAKQNTIPANTYDAYGSASAVQALLPTVTRM